MEIIIIAIISFLVSTLTFFSGFGLGTILTPVFMVFFPVDVSIALTGLVHLFNNIFKFFLVGKNMDKEVLIRFGIPAIIAAFLGSFVLLSIPENGPIFTYTFLGNQCNIYLLKLIVAILLIIFASMEISPYFQKLQFAKKYLPVGGFLSGFFGGLSGNQGALRAAFLMKAGLSKEAFIGTAVAVSTLVDFTRLGVYAAGFFKEDLYDNLTLVLTATISAIAGSFIGNKLFKKITLRFLQIFVAAMLILLAMTLAAGLI
jgi:uncharacterized membrane protein YfcA